MRTNPLNLGYPLEYAGSPETPEDVLAGLELSEAEWESVRAVLHDCPLRPYHNVRDRGRRLRLCIEAVQISFNERAKVVLRMYGFNPFFADVSARLGRLVGKAANEIWETTKA